MTLKQLPLALFFATSLVGAPAYASACEPQAGPLSLQQAIDQALCANPALRGYRLDVEAAQANADTARAAYLPSLSAAYSTSRQNNADHEVSQRNLALSWLLYDFGAREAKLSSAKASQQAASAVAQDQAQSLALSVAQSYFQVQASDAATAAALAQELAAKQALDVAVERHKAGEAIQLDVLQATSALAQAQLTRTKAVGNAATQRTYLAMLMGRPAEQAATVKLSDGPQDQLEAPAPRELASLVQEARLGRSDIAASKAKVESLEAQVKETKAAHLPSISLTGSLSRGQPAYGGNTTTNTIGLSVSIPLFSGGATSAKVRGLMAQAQAQQERLQATENQAAYDAVAAYETLQSASKQLTAARLLADSTKAAQGQALARYQAGVGTMLEVFDALSKNASADESLINARFGLQLARAQLARSLGQIPVL